MRSYKITPRPFHLGGGWNLSLIEGGEVAGSGVFPVEDGNPHAGVDWWNSSTQHQRAHWTTMAASAVPADAWHAYLLHEAYDDAQQEGEAWVSVNAH